MDIIGRLLSLLLELYSYVVIGSVVFSWLIAFNVVNGGSQVVRTIGEFFYRATEPALGRIRRFMPNLGPVDLSPVVLLIGIWVLQMVVYRVFF